MTSPQVGDRRDLSGLIADLRWVNSAITRLVNLLLDGVKLLIVKLILGEGGYE